MECIHCHTDNPVDAKYCRYCGQILKRNYEWIWIILMEGGLENEKKKKKNKSI